jgi:heat induced stress protein YflT
MTASSEPPVPAGPAGPTQTPDQAGELVELTRPQVTVARYADYASAQRAVDFLSDNGFPVERTAIIGTNLRLVETVLGRMTIGRAALAGAASGAWFGLFIGFLFTLFSSSAWWAVLLSAIVIGAIWGGVFGAIAHGLTGGRRDFTSKSTLQAGEYAVSVDAEVADEARALVTRLTWRTSGAS